MTYSDVPAGLKGLGITFITAGLMAIVFMAFAVSYGSIYEAVKAAEAVTVNILVEG